MTGDIAVGDIVVPILQHNRPWKEEWELRSLPMARDGTSTPGQVFNSTQFKRGVVLEIRRREEGWDVSEARILQQDGTCGWAFLSIIKRYETP